MTDRTRAEVVAAIADLVNELGWRIRPDDVHVVIILPPLATSRPERNRWPDEPEEREEPTQLDRERERDRLGEAHIPPIPEDG